MFRIAFEPEGEGIVQLTLGGFWDGAELDRFAAAFRQTVDRARRTHPHFSILSDSRNFAVQSAETSAGFMRIMTAMGAIKRGGRTAIIVATALNRMQASRVFAHPGIQVFMDLDEGRRWLESREA